MSSSSISGSSISGSLISSSSISTTLQPSPTQHARNMLTNVTTDTLLVDYNSRWSSTYNWSASATATNSLTNFWPSAMATPHTNIKPMQISPLLISGNACIVQKHYGILFNIYIYMQIHLILRDFCQCGSTVTSLYRHHHVSDSILHN